MEEEPSILVDIHQLRIGMYIVLDLGWLSHPFPVNRFRIASDSQLEILRELGLDKVRCIPSLSDSDAMEEVHAPVKKPGVQPSTGAALNGKGHAAPAPDLAQIDEQLSQLRERLEACDRRFVETTRQFRKLAENVQGSPAMARMESENLVNGCVQELLQCSESTIVLLSEGVGERNALHPVNVMVLCLLMGKAQGLEPQALQDLGMAALLHDIGKLKLPASLVLPFPGIQPMDLARYRGHVGESVLLGKAMGLPSSVLLAMAQHHEMADGSGFPLGLQNQDFSPAGRILTLVNHYDGLCNPLNNADALTPHEALSVLFSRLRAHFDTATLNAFIRMMGVYPPGSVVQLVNGLYALVVSVNSARPLRPKVIVHDPDMPQGQAHLLDLENLPELGIRRSLKPSQLPRAALDYLSPRQRICYFFERAVELPRYEDSV